MPVETVSDWLPHTGVLVGVESGLYYLADGLYRIAEDGGMPEFVRSVSTAGPVFTDGRAIVVLSPSGAPEIVSTRTERSFLGF